MVLRKLFLKTIGNVKSFFSNGYQKLPKSPTCNPYNACITNANLHTASTKESADKFYDFSGRWIDSDVTAKRKITFASSSPPNPSKHGKSKPFGGDLSDSSSRLKQLKQGNDYQGIPYSGRKKVQDHDREPWFRGSRTGHRQFAVAEKLRELKMMGGSDANHVADMEEFLYYYSRLTLPAYIDIVDKFFMEVWSEFFASSTFSNEGPRRGKVDPRVRAGHQRINRTPLRINS